MLCGYLVRNSATLTRSQALLCVESAVRWLSCSGGYSVCSVSHAATRAESAVRYAFNLRIWELEFDADRLLTRWHLGGSYLNSPCAGNAAGSENHAVNAIGEQPELPLQLKADR
jgi:hypothetical protein